MVCKLFGHIFFPRYLRRYKFSPCQSRISLIGLSTFRAFRSYHRFPHRTRAILSAEFSRDADADTEFSCLAYALAQFPAKTFRCISLYFRRHPIHAEPLTELLSALVRIQCSNLSINASYTGEHHIDILPTSMPPMHTTSMAWNLTNLTIKTLYYTPSQLLLQVFGASHLLKELTLCSGSLKATFPWKTLLKTTTFPTLRSFQASEDIPLPLLLDFLSRHPKVSTLAITVNKFSKHKPTDGVIGKIDLNSLLIISGPPSYILAVLHSASAAPSLARLSLLLNHLPDMLIFPEVLKCLAMCQKVEAFEVTLPRPNCRVSLATQTDNNLFCFRTLAIKVFRIIILDPDIDQVGDASSDDIMVSDTASNTTPHSYKNTFRLHWMNGEITSILLNTFSLKNYSPLMIVNLFSRNHVSDFQVLLCPFVWAVRLWKINSHSQRVASIGMYANIRI